MLKRISQYDHPTELEITRYFSTEPLASHPRNYSVPLYDALEIPGDTDSIILVFPLLRPYDNPPMKSVGEAVEFFRQVFEVCLFTLVERLLCWIALLSGNPIHSPVPCGPQVRYIFSHWE